MKNKNRTIERAENLIIKRIDALGQKIEAIKERWPADMYGGRCLPKIEECEEEISELQEYLEGHMFARTELEQAKEIKREMFQNKRLMRETIKALDTYGERQLAERLKRNLEWIESNS